MISNYRIAIIINKLLHKKINNEHKNKWKQTEFNLTQFYYINKLIYNRIKKIRKITYLNIIIFINYK